MPQLMPKHIEKGPMARKIEEAFRSPVVRAATLLHARVWQRDGAGANLADLLPGLDEQEREHFRSDWFGSPEQSFWVAADGASSDLGRHARRVVGAGLVEALEVSLGLATGEALDSYVLALAEASSASAAQVAELLGLGDLTIPMQAPLKRNLPLDIYWLCDMPLFESYISWNDRQVTVIIATAAVDSPMFALLPRHALQETAKTSWRCGMLVVQSSAPDDSPELGAATALLDRPAAQWRASKDERAYAI